MGHDTAVKDRSPGLRILSRAIWEAVAVLEYAIQSNPSDFQAPYFLGNYWYDKRVYCIIELFIFD